jgi:hypothetical protein
MTPTYRSFLSLLLTASVTLTVGCGGDLSGQIGDGVEHPGAQLEQPFTSDVATLMDFDFDGVLTSSSGSNVKGQVRAQLMYTVGHLNGEPGVARLDKLVLSNTSIVYIGGGLYRISYHAWLPVAWGSKTNLPSSYTFTLPMRVDASGQSTFTTKYASTCNDGEGADVSVNNFWYHYRPHAGGCSLAPGDVATAPATVTKDNSNSYLKYPEYQKIWEDGALNVVAVFGKYTAGARSLDDAGISAYNEFIGLIREEYPDATTVPASLPDDPGPGVTDITFTVKRGGGTININIFLVEAVTAVTSAWKARYAQLTPGADLIIYNGHAGLGANVAALSRMGKFFPGKYQILFLNGCDTFAYYDNTLPSIRAALNPDDPTGTKYMDFVTNSMPAYFASMAGDAMALIRAVANEAQPLAYQPIFHNMDRAQVVVVTGEDDNIFTPDYDPEISWNGMEETGAVAKYQTISYQTDVLEAGQYVFTTTPDPSSSGGDADLRIRVGAPPTITSTYKCKSYVANSNERCVVNLTAPGKIYIAVTGDATGVSSKYILRGWQQPAD